MNISQSATYISTDYSVLSHSVSHLRDTGGIMVTFTSSLSFICVASGASINTLLGGFPFLCIISTTLYLADRPPYYLAPNLVSSTQGSPPSDHFMT